MPPPPYCHAPLSSAACLAHTTNSRTCLLFQGKSPVRAGVGVSVVQVCVYIYTYVPPLLLPALPACREAGRPASQAHFEAPHYFRCHRIDHHETRGGVGGQAWAALLGLGPQVLPCAPLPPGTDGDMRRRGGLGAVTWMESVSYATILCAAESSKAWKSFACFVRFAHKHRKPWNR